MNALHDIFEQSTDAVLLLGYTPEQLCDTPCAEVLCGTDIQGHAFCGKHCPIPKTVVDSPSISDFDLVVRCAGI